MWPPWGNHKGCPYNALPKRDFFTPSEERGKYVFALSTCEEMNQAPHRTHVIPEELSVSQLPSCRRAGTSLLDLGLAGAARLCALRFGRALIARRALQLLPFCFVLGILGVHKYAHRSLVNRPRRREKSPQSAQRPQRKALLVRVKDYISLFIDQEFVPRLFSVTSVSSVVRSFYYAFSNPAYFVINFFCP